MPEQPILIAVINYHGALQSAVYGFQEMFALTNRICKDNHLDKSFELDIIETGEILQTVKQQQGSHEKLKFRAVILPPSIEKAVYMPQDEQFLSWIIEQHSSGAIICSVCSGAFILASTGLLRQRMATTHWGLSELFSRSYPEVITNTEKILINDGDIITAGGLMAWIDLGMELVTQFAGASVMRQLCRLLVIDSGTREQRYYQRFSPAQDHGSKDILKVQHYLQKHFNRPVTIPELSNLCCLTERTFLRRFVRATGLKPTQYLQKIRVQHACDLIETTDLSFANICEKVGYEDISAFRKVFIKITGLTPGGFKKRFGCSR